MIPLPTLRQLQYLVALADRKSFHRAAEACNVTQSTLSAGIKELEAVLLQPVVVRTTRKIHLTPLGEEIISESRNLLEKAEIMTHKARRAARPMSGPMRLGVIPTIAPYLLPTILPHIEKTFKNLEVSVHEGLSTDLTERMNEGTLDMALMAFPFKMAGFHQAPLFREDFYVAAPAQAFEKKDKLHRTDLEDQTVLLLEDGHCLRDHARDACGLRNIKQQRDFSAASLQTLIQMVRAGYGITLLPEMVVREGFLPNDLKILPFYPPAPTREIGIAWREKSYLEEDIAMICVLLKKLFEKMPDFKG
ncbi:MAG: hydrogen peroxide-inducible genes activator [Rhodospirillales bacterium]|nr:hydrogen peroxide-inducible genes activator [Alphaproteobacteria bacterium]USO03770.1 MAG: hydrogen peroxide-inducible genes activator [Rhodospirillales bacterium]